MMMDEESTIVDDDNTTYIASVKSGEAGQGFETSFTLVNPVMSGSDESASDSSWRGNWLCRPYKRERLLEEICSANRKGVNGHATVLNTLKNSGVMIFIIDSKVSITTADIMTSVHNVIRHVSKDERLRPAFNTRVAQRCLLYRDHEGRFFNLTLADHTTASAGQWRRLLDSFSGFQAIMVLTVLCRSFACATQRDVIMDQFKPAYLSLILGLVFTEEISLSWTNVGMFVSGMPSISAFAITSRVESDWLRKVLLFSLAMAGATSGLSQYALTLFGISLTCAVLLANLGSRAWNFLQWQPLGYGGRLEPIVSYVAAILTGIVFPYLGHRQVEAGGKAAMESVFRVAFLVAIVFVVSDYDEIQQFLVVGSQNCSQDWVNIAVGAWFAFSLIASLCMVMQIEPEGVWPEDEEPLLEADHSSPVGFKVPNLPDFPIDPSLANHGIPWLNIKLEFYLGIVMALALGGGICYLAFTDIDEEFTQSMTDNMDVFN